MEFLLLVVAVLSLALKVSLLHIVALLLHAVCGAWIAWKLARRQPLSGIFIAAYIAMYFPNPTAILLGWIPLEPESTRGVLMTANAVLMIGLDLFMIGARRCRLTRHDAIKMPPIRISPFPVDVCIMIALALGAFGMMTLIAKVGAMGVDVFSIRKSFRVTAGEQSTYYLLVAYVMMVLPLAAFLIGLKPVPLQIPYVIAVLLMLVYHFLIFRIRTVPIAVLMGWGTGMIFKHFVVSLGTRPTKGRLPAWVRLGVFVGIPLLALTGVAIKYLRASHGFRDYRVTRQRVAHLIGHTFAGGDLGYALFMRRALTLYPHEHAYLKGQSYYRMFFVPIPRSIWPSKPASTQRIFAAALDPKHQPKGITIPPGIVGDLYINFGYLGILGMVVFGIVFAQERYRTLTDVLYLAGSGFWIFHLVRGGFTNPVLTLIVIWVACHLFTKLLRPTRVPQPPQVAPGLPAAPHAPVAHGAGRGAARGPLPAQKLN
jgi:hypothetical protein